MDVVYVVKPSERNEELRYSLRSVAANLTHDRVWLSGFTPTWAANVGSIANDQTTSKHGNALGNLLAACRHPDVSERFVLMNDDFFVTAPVETVPTLHRGPIAGVLADYKRQFPRGSRYIEAMAETLDTLRSWSIVGGEPLSYEMHAPMVIHKAAMIEVIERARRCAIDVERIHNRSLYGNVARLGGERVEDVKVYGLGGYDRPPIPFLSTSDASFRRGLVGRHLRRMFPDAGAYEARTWVGIPATGA